MACDVLVLDSGHWELADELPAVPWHILVYQETHDRRNELHLWLPQGGDAAKVGYAFKRYWQDGDTRWCVEIPPKPDRSPIAGGRIPMSRRFRFMGSDGRVLWVESRLPGRLGDFTDAELRRLRAGATVGPYTLM